MHKALGGSYSENRAPADAALAPSARRERSSRLRPNMALVAFEKFGLGCSSRRLFLMGRITSRSRLCSQLTKRYARCRDQIRPGCRSHRCPPAPPSPLIHRFEKPLNELCALECSGEIQAAAARSGAIDVLLQRSIRVGRYRKHRIMAIIA